MSTDLEKHQAKDSISKDYDGQIHQVVTMSEVGHTQELRRQFSPVSMFFLSFSVLGTWATMAQNFSSGMTNGGPISIMWGLVLVTACNLCVAVSLGELTSAYPSALGQAFFLSKLWLSRTGRFASYITGWITTFGWWTLTASQTAFMTNIILSLKLLFDPDWAYGNSDWVKFLIYLAVTFFLTVINHISCRRDKVLPWIENVVGVTFVMLFFVMALALLITVGIHKNLHFQPAKFVFATWINQTGWPSGVTWFTGLIQASYGLTAFDACIHMVEELPDPTRIGPMIIWLSVLMGAITGWMFVAVLLGTIQDLDSVLNASISFVQIFLDTVGLTGTAVLIAIFVISGVGQNIGLTVTGSRMTWSLARDGGMPFHRYFGAVDETWKAPVRAIWLQGVIIALIGVLYLFANTVLQAILSVSTIALTISYAIPILALLIAGRNRLPAHVPFQLGRFGSTANVVSLVYCIVTTVFFFFPSAPDPAPANMNWAIAVFGVMLFVAVGFWFVQGNSSYLNTESATFRMDVDGADSRQSQGPDIVTTCAKAV